MTRMPFNGERRATCLKQRRKVSHVLGGVPCNGHASASDASSLRETPKLGFLEPPQLSPRLPSRPREEIWLRWGINQAPNSFSLSESRLGFLPDLINQHHLISLHLLHLHIGRGHRLTWTQATACGRAVCFAVSNLATSVTKNRNFFI